MTDRMWEGRTRRGFGTLEASRFARQNGGSDA